MTRNVIEFVCGIMLIWIGLTGIIWLFEIGLADRPAWQNAALIISVILAYLTMILGGGLSGHAIYQTFNK